MLCDGKEDARIGIILYFNMYYYADQSRRNAHTMCVHEENDLRTRRGDLYNIHILKEYLTGGRVGR